MMDMTRVSGICDFFVVLSSSSPTRSRTIADFVEEGLEKAGVRILHREGMREASWILLDFGDVICHIFLPEKRKYYDLETLWGDAKKHLYSR